MTTRIAPDAASHAVIDRIDRDTIALARLLVRLGASVTVLATRVADDVDAADLDCLRAAGVTVAQGDDVARIDAGSVLFAHDYTAPSAPVIAAARRAGCRITHLADLLLELTPALTIGVTGSAGKSTTAAMIGAILRGAGRPVYMARRHELSGSANPNWELLDEPERMDPAGAMVLELTSSHLEYMSRSPNVAVVTTITPDHIEWHGSLDAYVAAKRRIVAAQSSSDVAILNLDEPLIDEWARSAPGTVRGFSVDGRGDAHVRLVGDQVVVGDGGAVLMARDEIHLADGYVMNALAAAAAALSAGASREDVRAGLLGFDGLSGRRQRVAAAGGIEVYNDGLALTPRKAIASLRSFEDGSVLLLCGGEDVLDGWSVAPMHTAPDEQRLLEQFGALAVRKARRAFLVGSAGDRVREALAHAGFDPAAIVRSTSLEEATRQAISCARSGDNVLLAPVFTMGNATIASFPAMVHDAIERRRAA